MTTANSCQKITLGQALDRLPGPQAERSVSLFEHGSLVVKLYAPRGDDPQIPPSRDEVYVVAQGSGDFVCAGARQTFAPTTSCSRPSNIALKTSAMISRSGSFSMDRQAAR